MPDVEEEEGEGMKPVPVKPPAEEKEPPLDTGDPVS